jgi:uncharacterized protein YciI
MTSVVSLAIRRAGKYMIGSSFILEAGSKEEVEAFVHNDPFYAAGVWATVTVERYISVGGIKACPPSAL